MKAVKTVFFRKPHMTHRCFHFDVTVDSGEALDDDGASSQVSRLQGGVLPAGPLSIVFISNHNPVHLTGLNFTINQRSRTFLGCSQVRTRGDT